MRYIKQADDSWPEKSEKEQVKNRPRKQISERGGSSSQKATLEAAKTRNQEEEGHSITTAYP